jgi:hypothetical protein
MKKLVTIIIILLLSTSLINCGKLLSKRGGYATLAGIKDPPQFTRLATSVFDKKFPEWAYPWDSCYYTSIDVLYGTNITGTNALDIWTEYMIASNWRLISGYDSQKFLLRGNNEGARLYDSVSEFYISYIDGTEIDIDMLKKTYKKLIQLEIMYYYPNTDTCL